MITSDTSEIRKSLKSLKKKLLKKILKKLNANEHLKDKTKRELSEVFQRTVIQIGIQDFVGRLDHSQLENACEGCGIQIASKENLVEHIKKIGMLKFQQTLNLKIIQSFCEILGLEVSPNEEEMAKLVDDEVMLTGMNRILKSLDKKLLKKFCKSLRLETDGSEEEIVDRIMCDVFELEPAFGKKKNKGRDQVRSRDGHSPKREKLLDDEKKSQTTKTRLTSSKYD